MWREIGFLAGVALAVTLVTFVFVWAPHKAVNVKRNHFFLKVFAALDLPPWLCRMIVPKSPARDADGVASFDGVFVSTRDRRDVPYRLYVPHNETCSSEVLLWVHGGGFVLGSISDFQIDDACRMMALKSRMRVISVEYRKTPEFSLLSGGRDVEETLLFASQHYSRIALGGESAGATLALGAALKHPELVQHLLLVYPGMEHGIDVEKMRESWIIDTTVMAWFRSHHLAVAIEREDEGAVLQELLKEAETHLDVVAKLPSTHIISAGLDPLHLGSTKLEDKLRRANVSVIHDHYPESDHGFFSFGIEQSEIGIENAVSRIRETLRKGPNETAAC